MFNIPVKLDKGLEEGIVMEIDAKRLICKVVTVFGKNLTRVKWVLPFGGASRAGDRGTPSQGDRVILSYGLGYPLIIGFLPELDGVNRNDPSEIAGEEYSVDTGNFSGSAGSSSMIDPNKPRDFLSGDRVFSTLGGALLGLLRGGSILIRSGAFSEIFISKLSNLVRVVSGNWEHFTDVCTDVIKNYRGRVYRYTGYNNTYLAAKNEVYSYEEFTGDTALSKQMKASYISDVIPIAQSDIIRRELVTVGEVGRVDHKIGLAGLDETIITNTSGITTIKNSGDEIVVSHKSIDNIESIAVIDITGILVRTGASGATQKASLHIYENGNIEITHDGFLNVNTTGAANVIAGGKATVKGAIVDIDGGGGEIGGVIQSSCICAFTGAPHGHISGSVNSSK